MMLVQYTQSRASNSQHILQLEWAIHLSEGQTDACAQLDFLLRVPDAIESISAALSVLSSEKREAHRLVHDTARGTQSCRMSFFPFVLWRMLVKLAAEQSLPLFGFINPWEENLAQDRPLLMNSITCVQPAFESDEELC